MNEISSKIAQAEELPTGAPVNISRRGFLVSSIGAAAGALVIGFGLPLRPAKAQLQVTAAAPGTKVPAFLEIRPDNTVRFLSPFMEGGQGIFTAMAQIVGEELDMDPQSFIVESAPAGSDYLVVFGKMRITGGSMSVRSSFETMRKLGASARAMIVEAASDSLGVPVDQLTTEPGYVVHAASGKRLTYGQLATAAMQLPVPAPETVTLRDSAQFRWIGKPVKRLDMVEKSTGKAIYGIDCKVEGMLHAAVQHAPRLGLSVGAIRNEKEILSMPGVHSVHQLPGAVAVVAERWWVAKTAVEGVVVEWAEPGDKPLPAGLQYMPADFSSAAFSDRLAGETGEGVVGEAKGNVRSAFDKADHVISATYRSQFLNHAQLEPPSALARFNADGTLEMWMPNQAPEMFQDVMVSMTGLKAKQIKIHSPLLGGFFGRHSPYAAAHPFAQAIPLAKAVGRPVKVIWTREEEFHRDALRPMAAVRFKGVLDEHKMPIAIEAITATEGPTEALAGHNPDKVDDQAVEGLTGKSYAIPNTRFAQQYVKTPAIIAYWRSVGNSMNDFFYESFLDELADAGEQDPFELRRHLLKDNARLTTLLEAVGELSGGWKRGPFTAEDGTRRARGIAMASPFGTHTAAIAEVSVRDSEVVVHDVWQAIDPGKIVNPAIIDAQINSAVAMGLSQALIEEARFERGEILAKNYDLYPILSPAMMPRVHTKIVESGEAMGGIGEPGLPAVPPAVANAVSHLTGKRVRSMPMSRLSFDS